MPAPGAKAAVPSTPPRTAGERRQLTVMFCDLVGYTELSHRVDPEELPEILTSYQQACVRAVGRYEGHVAQYLGDGLLVYFGFPQAREDAAERAVRAALAIRAALAALNEQRAQEGAESIAARIGIHTGQVVVTEIGGGTRPETLALGNTINIAARLESLAGPDEIYVSHTTLRLVPGVFRTRDLGSPPLKGVTERIRVHAVDALVGIALRFGASGVLTPLSGRDQELAQLHGLWEQALGARGHVVLLSGEPGIGKSRLVHGLAERIANTTHFTIEFGCSPYTTGSAFQPLVELLERALGFSEEDPPETRLEKLESQLARIAGLDLAGVVPFLGALLGLPESERYPLAHMGRELQREHTIQALIAPFTALAARQPVLIVCEDLQWSDPSTLEVLGRLIDAAPAQRMLLVLTFRPDFKPPWPAKASVIPLAVQRLTRHGTLAVVRAAVHAASGLTDETIDALVERADGVPLFAEELARSVADSSTSPDPGERFQERSGRVRLRIPSTLQDSLMARLDRLGIGKHVAQVAAALGRTFGYPMIEAVADLDARDLRQGLAQLVDAEILFQRGTPPQASYTFKHALVLDTAYESQLKTRRRELHARIVSVLKERFPQRVVAEPEVVARHSAEGGLLAEAVEYYRQAGEQAAARLSHVEAHGYLARALELLGSLSEDETRDAREIDLRMAQAGSLGALRGYEDPELVASIARTHELCEEIGVGPQQIPGLLKLMLFHTHELPRARRYAETLLALVEPLGIAPLLVAGYMIRGTGALTSATVSEACADLKKALEIAETAELQIPKAALEVDAKAMACCTYAMALVLSGKPDTAAGFVERGVRRARELGHPRTLASALQNGAMAFTLMDEPAPSGELSDRCIELIKGRGFHEIEVSARVLSGWARGRRGDLEATVAMDAALRSAEEHGVLAGMTQLYFKSAEIHSIAGRHARAFEQLSRGEAFSERVREQFGYEPTAKLMRAQIMLEATPRDFDAISSLLLRALALAERNQSPWDSIRAATLLGRVAIETGKGGAEAHARLQELYARFSEGFERQRLREARAVLTWLASA